VFPEAAGKPIDTERFKTRSQCFITQYGNFLLPEAGGNSVGTEQYKTRSHSIPTGLSLASGNKTFPY
jgi:hypothetical protein